MAEQEIVAAARAVAALFREQRFYWLSRSWDEVQALLRATDAAVPATESMAASVPAQPSERDVKAASPSSAAAQGANGPTTEPSERPYVISGETANGDEPQAPQRV